MSVPERAPAVAAADWGELENGLRRNAERWRTASGPSGVVLSGEACAAILAELDYLRAQLAARPALPVRPRPPFGDVPDGVEWDDSPPPTP